jgi:arylsulfatase A-like enzyme
MEDMARTPERPFEPRWSAWLLLGVLASCGGALPPAWIPLASEARLQGFSGAQASSHPWHDGRSVELVHEGDVASLRVPLEREDWRFSEEYGLWHVPIDLHVPTQRKLGTLELSTSAGLVPRSERSELTTRRDPAFGFKDGSLLLAGFGDAPPEEAVLSVRLPRGASEGARFRHEGVAGRGLSMLSGERAGCRVDIPPDSALRFGLASAPLLGGMQEPGGSVFRIRLDGEVLFETRKPAGEDASCAWHTVPLPAEGRAGAQLAFKVEGALAHAVFVDPVIGPREVGRRGARPWAREGLAEAARPDIVVLLADTFRADNLAAYGGRPGVTPNLDGLAAQGLCFRRAWSTATWTLPAHASLFSGYYPTQVLGAGSASMQLPGQVATVAERLERHGYRTGALTEGGFVSSHYGLDQGFAFFGEGLGNTKRIERLLDEARAFLAADDGRPLFLFVHTYRAHWPFEVSARARGELGELLGLEGDRDELLAEVVREAQALGAKDVRLVEDMNALPRSPRMLELARTLRAHYLGGVSDLDHALGGFLDEFRADGLLEHGYLVFTSDHGEGFLQHSALFHSSAPHEEQTRIPLLVVGRGLAGRSVDEPASLVDLAPTVMAMAGLPPDPDWPGRSLLAPGPSRALFGLGSWAAPDDSLFLLEADRKVFLSLASAENRLLAAYDLAEDAGEERDLSGASWSRALLDQHRATLAALLAPRFADEDADGSIELDERKAAELEALGY